MTNNELFEKLSNREFRAKLIADPSKYGKELGYSQENVEFKVVHNSKDTIYIAMGAVADLDADKLNQIQAAGTQGSASTGGSASSIGTITTSVSSASSAATVGTAGTH